MKEAFTPDLLRYLSMLTRAASLSSRAKSMNVCAAGNDNEEEAEDGLSKEQRVLGIILIAKSQRQARRVYEMLIIFIFSQQTQT